LIRENCKMLGVTIVRCVQSDGRRALQLDLPLADRVLVDAPCTGTGTFRRKVDLKWRLSSEDFQRLACVQKELFAAAVSVLKPGGVLVYSVCSIDRAETDGTICAGHSHSHGLALDDTSPPWMSRFRTPERFFRIMPGHMGMDGFFMARFVKAG